MGSLRFSHIIFDLDGTLIDPAEGITNAIQYTLNKLKLPILSRSELRKFIGPPLLESFQQFCKLSREEAQQAVKSYREFYRKTGIYQHHLYPHIKETLMALHQNQAQLYIGTSKPTLFAQKIATNLRIKEYFNQIVGSNLDHTRTAKAEIIDVVLTKIPNLDKETVVMIGDRKFDIEGAKANHIASIGVLYGYGSFSEITGALPTYLCKNIGDLPGILGLD